MERRDVLRGLLGLGTMAIIPGLAACGDSGTGTTRSSPAASLTGVTPSDGSASRIAPQPTVRSSTNGLLATTLTAANSQLAVLGETIDTMVYEGSLPGPTLRVSPGDTVRISLTNNLAPNGTTGAMGMGPGQGGMGQGQAGMADMSDNGTNLHTHGLHVSPTGNSDNVFLDIPPGGRQEYEIRIPADHWGGLNWYHPHRHGSVSLQVLGGMAGALIVSGPLDKVPEVAAATDQVLILQRIQNGPAMIARMSSMHDNRFLSLSGNPAFTTNGQVNPHVQMRPGEVQRWQIVNADPIDYFDLALLDQRRMPLPGGLKFLARDGMTLPALATADSHLMVPGNRFDLLVQAPGNQGVFTLTGRTAAGFGQPDIDFLTVSVTGDPKPMTLPARLPSQVAPIAAEAVTTRRTVTYGSWQGAMTVNGVAFDQGPDVLAVKVGTVEEWTIQNLTDQPHAFHIHTNPFLVVAENGRPVATPAFWDTYPIPPATGPESPGSITVRMHPVDFTGRIVQHCHILPHEDAGMMGVVDLV
jgi:FtsP/CotA-like multicopper oxidase with cupredoxin domain